MPSNVYAVILVGGKGKRLRPLSTDAKPKAFLSVTKDRKTMFRRTIDRAERIVDPSHIVVVANKIHAALVKKDDYLIGKHGSAHGDRRADYKQVFYRTFPSESQQVLCRLGIP